MFALEDQIEAKAKSLNLDEVEELIERELMRWRVPALEVVAVKDGGVVLAKAFGTSDIAKGLPATAKTLFHHGSIAKTFTAFLIGTLVDDGLLEWNRPVRNYLPEFRVSNSETTDKITIRDLLSHRTGLPRHEWVWVSNPSRSREEIVGRIRHLPLSRALRQEWQYCNLGYTTAGLLAGEVAGSSWEEQIVERVFDPLDMTRTFTKVRSAEDDPDHAVPFMQRDDEVEPTFFRQMDNVAPASQLISCAEDMAHWLLCQTGNGEFEGRRVISEAALKETQTLQISAVNIQENPRLSHIKFHGYCMGWFTGTYRGQEWLWHNGWVDGFRSEMGLVPSARAGVLVSANLNASPLPFAILQIILDELLGIQPRPYSYDAYQWIAKGSPSLAEPTSESEVKRKVHNLELSHFLSGYVGVYRHPGYGELAVSCDRGELRFKLNELDLESKYCHSQIWDIRYTPLESGLSLTFLFDHDGRVSEAIIPLEPRVGPIRFFRSEGV